MVRKELALSDKEAIGRLWEIYEESFPDHEKRSFDNFIGISHNEHARITAYYDGTAMVGFLLWWSYPEYDYIEHFAVSSKQRGGGLGSQIVRDFAAGMKPGKPLILEIEAIVDEITRRRFDFYSRLGFVRNGFNHVIPTYDTTGDTFDTVLLTYPAAIGEELYDLFYKRLMNDVMIFD